MTERPLPTPVRQVLTEHVSEPRLQPIWQGIAQRRARVSSNSRIVRQLVFASALVVLGIAAILWRPSHEPLREQRVLWSPVPTQILGSVEPIVQPLGNGAQLSVGRNSTLDVLRQTPTEMLMALRRGNAHFDIRPSGLRKWVVECGGVTVEVIGTEFTLDRNSDRITVSVQRGRVLVRGAAVPDTVQILTAGQNLSVGYSGIPNAVSEPSAAPAPAASEPSAAPAPAASEAGISRAPVRRKGEDWRLAAREKNWQLAWQSLGAEGVNREAARADDVMDLLALADVARLSGHPGQAVLPLQQIISAHSGDARAALAAFTLGKVQLDQLGNAGAAASAFERALALRLPAALAEDTLARLVEAHARAGNREQSLAMAQRYRLQFPQGHRSADVERWSQSE